ncbi:MAG: carboxypeptidase M32 [Anaerolineae bacterium]|nr:carboxypeptidase M32 [Anaerolineae bacterium]
MGKHLEELVTYSYRPIDLSYIGAVLGWDQQVNMPPLGVETRANQLSTLSAIIHELATSDEMCKLLEAAESEVAGCEYDSDEASMVRAARRNYDKLTRLPTEFVVRQTQATSKAYTAWTQARAESNFALFRSNLEEVVALEQERTGYLGYTDHPYDALLDQYEPRMKTAQVEKLFETLKAGLVPLVQAIAQAEPIDDSFFEEQEYDLSRQWDFTMMLLGDIGYDFQRGRQDKAPHPFTTNFSTQDVRVTTRLLKNRPQSAFFSSLHEGGHALYEQGINPEFDRTALAGGATMGLHESQSRMWENQVGRSESFWRHYYPIMRAFFPEQMRDVSFERFYRGINKVKPDFIRVEADEVTYNLHIFVRFELEKDLITGALKVADIPDAWNAKYQAYLGITPPNDAQGCLQDVHWTGMFGYFPTYTLGNLISAQLYAQAQKDLPGLEEGFAQAEFAPLLDWTREKVHRHGAKFNAEELLERTIGQTIQAQPLLDYIKRRYSAIYNLE